MGAGSTMQGAVFKRIQFPPLILISRGAFGNDVREAQMRRKQRNATVSCVNRFWPCQSRVNELGAYSN